MHELRETCPQLILDFFCLDVCCGESAVKEAVLPYILPHLLEQAGLAKCGWKREKGNPPTLA